MKTTIAHLIADYTPFPPTYPAGTESRVEQVARRQNRYRPLVLCKQFDGQCAAEQIDAMTIRRVPIGRLYRRLFQKLTRLDPWPYTERLWQVARAEQAALLHLHNEPKLLAGLHRQLQRHPMPVVVHVANEKPLPDFSVPLVTHWVACSQYIARWLQEENAIPADKISVIYTGVDAAARAPHWAVSAEERQSLRAQFGISNPQARVLLFAGRIVKEKGVDELLDAFELLRQQGNQDLYLLIAGNVRDSDDQRNEKAVYGKAVTARIAQMQGVRWVGSLHPHNMHHFLLAGDLFVMPSIWPDPFPTVMIEAAAAGLPIVAAARGGITEFLSHCPGNVFVDNPADPKQLATSISAWMEDPARRDSVGRWLRQCVEGQFDWSRVCLEFEQLYDRLLLPQAKTEAQ